jgi:hypothetical protein
MTWTKTSDDHPDRRLDVSDAAYRLEHAALTYSNRLLLDGRIPRDHLRMLPVPDRCLEPPVLAELVDRGIWIDEGDAYVLVAYFTAQPSRDEVEADRAYARVRQRIAYEKTAEGKAALKPEADAARQALLEARDRRRWLASQREDRRPHNVSHVVPVPAPARPGPVPTRARAGTTDEDRTSQGDSQRENRADLAAPTNGQAIPPCSDLSRGLWDAHRNDRHAGNSGLEHCRACGPIAGCRFCAPTRALAG